jgi:hypothetical protein
MPKPFAGLLIRPEVRYDRALTRTKPFDQLTDRDQWTLAIDAILELVICVAFVSEAGHFRTKQVAPKW